MKNQIIINEGIAQFIFGDGSGRIITTAVNNVYSVFNIDTVSFVLIGLPKSSGLSLFTTRAEDLELNGVTYSIAELPDAVAEAFAPGDISIHFEVVDELPLSGESDVIYLVAASESGESNVYDEYVWLESEERYEKIGSTEMNALVAGRGISITTGATADTISLDFPISGGTGLDSLLMSGSGNTANGDYSVAYGKLNSVNGECGLVNGNRNISNNFAEVAFGQKNISRTEDSTSFGHSGNTLFVVGNGIETEFANATHNAFEIRGNGDIYISNTNATGLYYEKPMIKLQDALVDNISSGECQQMIDASISGKTNQSDFSGHTADTTIHVTNSEKSNWNAKSDFSGSYNDLTDKPTIPTSASQLTNDSGYITSGDAQSQIDNSLSGYVTTNSEQTISGKKIFTYSSSSDKAIEFKQTSDSAKVGFIVTNTASTNNELATFEFRPNTFTIDNVQHPLLYFGHYRSTAVGNAGVPQTVVGFRQFDNINAAAYHYLMPLPEKAKTPFGLTTTFKDYYAPMGFKNGSTLITADNTGVVDLSSELGGLKLVKLSQSAYDALSPNYDSNTLYVIVN